jgi:ADP-heptose:LPS heptosyltransferase
MEVGLAAPRILVIKLSSLGDIFHALPAVHNLKLGLGAEIDWVTQPEYRELVSCFTDVERVITFPRRQFLPQAGGFFRELRRERYDYIIDFQGLLKSAITARMARGARRIGPSFHREGSRLLYAEVAGPCNRSRHAVDQNLDVVDHLGLDRVDPVFPVQFPFYSVTGEGPKVALVPCSRWPAKNWSPESFARVGTALHRDRGARLYLVGGPADCEACARLAEGLPDGSYEDTSGRTSILELGGLLGRMDLVITVDSGPMHMAVAAGSRVLALFGVTDPQRTGPYGNRHRVIRSNPDNLPPSWYRRDDPEVMACMQQLSPDEVIEQAKVMLGEGV